MRPADAAEPHQVPDPSGYWSKSGSAQGVRCRSTSWKAACQPYKAGNPNPVVIPVGRFECREAKEILPVEATSELRSNPNKRIQETGTYFQEPSLVDLNMGLEGRWLQLGRRQRRQRSDFELH